AEAGEAGFVVGVNRTWNSGAAGVAGRAWTAAAGAARTGVAAAGRTAAPATGTAAALTRPTESQARGWSCRTITVLLCPTMSLLPLVICGIATQSAIRKRIGRISVLHAVEPLQEFLPLFRIALDDLAELIQPLQRLN